MTERPPDVMARLEKAVERLSTDGAPLEELVAAHQDALKLLDEAEAELTALRARAAAIAESLKQ